jgi:hypothetical protein
MDAFYSTYLLTHCFSEHWRKINSQKTEVEEPSDEIPRGGNGSPKSEAKKSPFEGERSQPAEVEFVVGRGMLKKIASSSRGQWTPRNDGK